MSNTIRRKKFNKKNHFFIHYWEVFSDNEVNENILPLWKYHSDNYYTKSCKNRKQFVKNKMDRKLRYDSKQAIKNQQLPIDYLDSFDIVLPNHRKYNVKNMIH